MGTLGYIYTLHKYIICIATIYNEKLNISFEEIFRLRIYIPFGCASGNIDPMPGMSHYMPCLIAE
jgi:hypothetical protein